MPKLPLNSNTNQPNVLSYIDRFAVGVTMCVFGLYAFFNVEMQEFLNQHPKWPILYRD